MREAAKIFIGEHDFASFVAMISMVIQLENYMSCRLLMKRGLLNLF